MSGSRAWASIPKASASHPSPEKAAPIPAEVLALAELTAKTAWKSCGKGDLKALIARAIMQDRADRASQEECIREDERDRLLLAARSAARPNMSYRESDAIQHVLGFFEFHGAMLPADRARLRGGAKAPE